MTPPRWDCHALPPDARPDGCDPVIDCPGHTPTERLELVASVLAWADGVPYSDGIAFSGLTAIDYLTTAALALHDLGQAR